MRFFGEWQRRIKKKYRVVYKRGPSRVAMMFAGVALSAWVGFLLLSGYPVVQYAYYTLKPATSEKLAEFLSNAQEKDAIVAGQQPSDAIVAGKPDWLPEIDVSLPGGQYLTIPKIGVDTVLWEGPTEDYESVLRRGVWRVPEMPKPTEGTPVILAAHRFGYLEWSNEYRRKNSFFNLPKLEPGNEIEIVWDQRRFTYLVERVVEGEEIDDYSADLILYTCKFLVSPERIMVYANRI